MDQSTNPGVTSEETVVAAGEADAVVAEETKTTEATEVAAEPATEGAEEVKEEASPEAATETPAEEPKA